MLDPGLTQWLDAQANALDLGACDAETVLPQLARAGVLQVGISTDQGGSGGDLADAVEVLSSVASHSLAAAFVLWGQRAFIEYLLQSPNAGLREQLLPDLLNGRMAGATGLSNAMKFLSGIEALQIRAQSHEGGWTLEGQLHWVTNLRKNNFVVAAAIEPEQGGVPFIVAIPDSAPGLYRSADLELMGLQSSNTAALSLERVELSAQWLLHEDARSFLPVVRPAFLGLQCGLAIGLARRSLVEVGTHLESSRSGLRDELFEQRGRLENVVLQLKQGLLAQRFVAQPAALFQLRIALAESAANAVQLELQASGGKAYLSAHGAGFARRWRESAFVPIVTPSLVQLRAELQRQAQANLKTPACCRG
ncbi:acyl-CoA dehydrogenase family protein [Pseudomonas sp. CCI3.2]|uniref:acyl-CoA dehydrogenase family protein n=1 Tax=unclassified Pseudomonas TaxID=196821 RepID=UPI002AC97BE6|nr:MULTISPECIES: acyl-CoA dehydrogenase family protein [unclassified Pseudomonas]MEB0076114.1 acyl-CoA dehydrogenase family protein [Pseudomonas sp. MH10out]MEB0090780.1 acyl-CoA dehydrogenase family protein [Pseudomonas sp. CCI4.2]MEB0100086.1 acyl-CoA dehydrogenase family protein [Pseudomonas sp. CCI3.2]MEB0132069.1 acyl-CoA dehydrogenase family protein [Pseudomonas sp. CCI2.4]MEB0156133.1 acyl-CoA dehydrogenase family protein [Pseudomonas sp. AH2 (2023)]